MHVVERFSHFAVELRDRPPEREVLHHAKRALIDWHAALLPGAVVPPSTLLEACLGEELDRGNSHLALGRRATARAAALINGTAAHTAEFDDIFRDGIYHPGAPTIAAGLALAQSRRLGGMELLKAIVVGYEISTRIGAAMGRSHYRYWHSTGTIGCFGAAAACAELLGLDADRFAHALATAATFSAGLQQAFRTDSMAKPLHAGRAAEAGLTAALAAAEGATGSLDLLEAEEGYAAAMGYGDQARPDWQRVLGTLGETFHIAQMTFKNHGCCGHTFAAIDGAMALVQKMNVRPEEIDEIEVGAYRAAVDVSHHENPRTPAEARFSLKYVVATALVHGSVRLSAFREDKIRDPTTRALMDKIRVRVDPELDAAFPGARAARVAITARGRREEFLQPTRIGDPDRPLTDAELDRKFLELAAPVLGDAPAARLLDKLWHLEAQQTLG